MARNMGVGYTAQNGLPYRSIGRWLIDNGKLSKDEMSMQRLHRYLAEHPSERDEIFAYNESYVFFRVLRDGPLGSLGVPVTGGSNGGHRLPAFSERSACPDSNANSYRRRFRSAERLAADQPFRAQSRYRRRDSRPSARRYLFWQRRSGRRAGGIYEQPWQDVLSVVERN